VDNFLSRHRTLQRVAKEASPLYLAAPHGRSETVAALTRTADLQRSQARLPSNG
jgi:hypothetical protein